MHSSSFACFYASLVMAPGAGSKHAATEQLVMASGAGSKHAATEQFRT
jgi:hypothetical protein